MFAALNQAAENFKDLISLFGTLGTWAAVFTALYIANKTKETKLEAYLCMDSDPYSDDEEENEEVNHIDAWLKVEIANISEVMETIQEKALFLKLPFWTITHFPKMDVSNLPLEILPYRQETFSIYIDCPFHDWLVEEFNLASLNALNRIRLRNLQCRLIGKNGKVHKVCISSEIRNLLRCYYPIFRKQNT